MSNPLVKVLHDKLIFQRRTRQLANQLSALMPANATILDIGCGDGQIDRMILQDRPDLEIKGIDVLIRPQTQIPVEAYDGKKIPLPDNSVDYALFVDVLHHTDSPRVLIEEACRVARYGLLIKDHLMDSHWSGQLLRAMDWVGNAPQGVALPYNYWSSSTWRSTFKELALDPQHWNTQLRLYPPLLDWLFGRDLHFIALLQPSSAHHKSLPGNQMGPEE